jgi:hypothetical protein
MRERLFKRFYPHTRYQDTKILISTISIFMRFCNAGYIHINAQIGNHPRIRPSQTIKKAKGNPKSVKEKEFEEKTPILIGKTQSEIVPTNKPTNFAF